MIASNHSYSYSDTIIIDTTVLYYKFQNCTQYYFGEGVLQVVLVLYVLLVRLMTNVLHYPRTSLQKTEQKIKKLMDIFDLGGVK